MALPANPIDLTLLASVKSWAGVNGSSSDQSIQDAITSFSNFVLTYTSRGAQGGGFPTASPLCEVMTFSETYDGNDSDTLFVRNNPITGVTSLTINNNVINQSTAWGVTGWVIDGNGKCIKIRGGGGGSGPSFNTTYYGAWTGCGQFFVRGIQNVSITYSAGFAQVPFDLEMCARKVVALNYKRSQWIGQRSRDLAQGAGTITYADWEMDKDCWRTLNSYKRVAPV